MLGTVSVIGAGLTGLSTGLHLVERGISAVLFDAKKLASGATSLSAGQLLAGTLDDPFTLAARIGMPLTRDIWSATVRGRRQFKHFLRSHSIDCCLWDGYVFTGLTPRQAKILEGMTDFLRRQAGLDRAVFLDRRALQAHIRAPLYRCGLFDPEGGSLDPTKLAVGLAQAVLRRGGEIREHTPVLGMDRERDGRLRLRLGTGECVSTDQVVLCGNAYLQGDFPQITAMIQSVTSSVCRTEALDPVRLDGILPGRVAFSDWRRTPDYGSVTADGSLLFGGGARLFHQRARDPRPWLARRLARVFPDLTGVTLEAGWEGRVAVTRSGLPWIGRVAERVWVAHGCNGTGLVFAWLAGERLAAAIAGEPDALFPFDRVPQNAYPPGWCKPLWVAGQEGVAWFRDRVP